MSPALFAAAALTFMGIDFVGQLGPDFENNVACYQYIGCNAGFGGYDAICHFVFGITVAVGAIWFSKRHPRRTLLSDSPAKSVFLILAYMALLAVVWEMCEFAYDYLTVIDLAHPLMNADEIQFFAQPTNADTIGDIFWSLFGTLLTLVSIHEYRPRLLSSKE